MYTRREIIATRLFGGLNLSLYYGLHKLDMMVLTFSESSSTNPDKGAISDYQGRPEQFYPLDDYARERGWIGHVHKTKVRTVHPQDWH